MFVILILSILFRVPIAISMGFASISGALLLGMKSFLPMIAQGFVTTVDSFPLLAVPFFIATGVMMQRSNIAESIIRAAEAVVGSSPGGLGAATIVACAIFSAISGSGAATTAAIGSIMFPLLVESGYDKRYSITVIMVASAMGMVIPPSIPAILYGVACGVSVTDVFKTSMVAGLTMVGAFLILNYFICKKRGYASKEREGNWIWVLKQVWDAKYALLMPVIILGGIYSGVFTPTEAAIVATIYAIFVGVFINRALDIPKLLDAFRETVIMNGTIMVMLGGAVSFGRILALKGIPNAIANALSNVTESSLVIMLILNIVILFIGMFFDAGAAIILFAPLMLPIILNFNLSPLWFGTIMILNLSIGLVTPPIGWNLFVGQAVTGIKIDEMIKDLIPYLIVMIVVLLALSTTPGFLLWILK